MLNYTLYSKIVIPPNRQRREFEPAAINELRESIAGSCGLLHAIVVREEAGELYLVAGERRLRAIRDLYALGGSFRYNGVEVAPDHVPYTTLGMLSELEREEAELEENCVRRDLSWQEKAQATARLAALRSKQAENAQQPVPAIADIALEVRGSSEGRACEATRREMIVARHLDNPQVAKAKTMDEAFKLLKREESLRKHREIAETVGLTFTSASHSLHNVDSLEWMKTCPAGFFDVILTDPPYGMNADIFGNNGHASRGGHEYDDDFSVFERCVRGLAEEALRIAKPQAHLYCFCDIDQFSYLRQLFTDYGWHVHRTPLIWHKPNDGRVPWIGCGPRRHYELILYAEKGGRPCTAVMPDVVSISSDVNLGHRAQKPVALYENLLSRSCRAGDNVLDPFGGSGPIVEAGHNLKIRVTYLERDPAFYGIALARKNNLKD